MLLSMLFFKKNWSTLLLNFKLNIAVTDVLVSRVQSRAPKSQGVVFIPKEDLMNFF